MGKGCREDGRRWWLQYSINTSQLTITIVASDSGNCWIYAISTLCVCTVLNGPRNKPFNYIYNTILQPLKKISSPVWTMCGFQIMQAWKSSHTPVWHWSYLHDGSGCFPPPVLDLSCCPDIMYMYISAQSRADTSRLQLCLQMGCKSDLTPLSSRCLFLVLRKEEVDPLGYGLAALGWEQSLFFGNIQHCLGHLIQSSFICLKPSCCIGVPRTQLHMPVLQRDERHKKVDQVAGHQFTLCKPTYGRSNKSIFYIKKIAVKKMLSEYCNIPWDSIVSARRRCSRSSMPMSSRFWPECQKSSATSAIVAPPILLYRKHCRKKHSRGRWVWYLIVEQINTGRLNMTTFYGPLGGFWPKFIRNQEVAQQTPPS